MSVLLRVLDAYLYQLVRRPTGARVNHQPTAFAPVFVNDEEVIRNLTNTEPVNKNDLTWIYVHMLHKSIAIIKQTSVAHRPTN